MAARVHLVLGPVGSGKSTFARALARERLVVRFALDDWMVRLFSADRPERGVMEWYQERSARAVGQIWQVAQSVVGVGASVVLELGLLQRRQREAFYDEVEAVAPLVVYVLDADRGVRRERVRRRNRERGATFSMHVPVEIFELASDLWEEVSSDECEGRDVRFIRTDALWTEREERRKSHATRYCSSGGQCSLGRSHRVGR